MSIFKKVTTEDLEELETLPSVEYEDLIEAIDINNTANTELSETIDGIVLAKESIDNLLVAISLATEAIKNNTVTKNDSLYLNLCITNTVNIMSLPFNPKKLSAESITDPKQELLLAIEDANSVVSVIITAIRKIFARMKNVLNKYLSKYDTMLLNIWNNLDSSLKTIHELEDKGVVPYNDSMGDRSIMEWHGKYMLGMLGLGDTKDDPVSGILNVIKNYEKPTYVSDLVDKIVSMTKGDLKPLYNNTSIIERLERNLDKKVHHIYCASGKEDRMVIGATYTTVYILERCRPLHISAKVVPYTYSINSVTYDTIDLQGNATEMRMPTYKEMYKLIEEAKKVSARHKIVTKEIHDVLSFFSKEADKIDDASDWANIGIYRVIPTILMVLAKTYADVPSAVNSFAKMYIKELKSGK